MHPRAGAGLVGGPDRSRLHRWLMAGALATGLTVVGLALGGGLGALGFFAVLVGGDPDGTVGLLLVVALSELGYLALAAAYLLRYGPGLPFDVPSARSLAVGVGATAALVALGQVVLWLVPGAGINELSGTLDESGVDPAFLLGFAAVAFVLVGPAEELLFRGAVQGTLRSVFGPVGSNVGASVLFALVHAPNVLTTPPLAAAASLSVIFVVSLVLGHLYERTGSLTVPVLVHSGYDAALLVLAYLVTTGALG